MAPPDSALLYKVAYDEAVRALAEQQAVIESLRSRTGLLLSAAAVTTSFLGAQALHRGDPSPIGWLALATFVAVSSISLAILWPRQWEFAADDRCRAADHRGDPLGHRHRILSASRLRR